MTKIPQYRIVNETGISVGTRIVDVDTGEQIKNVRILTLTFDANDVVRGTFEIVGVAVDAQIMKDGCELIEAKS